MIPSISIQKRKLPTCSKVISSLLVYVVCMPNIKLKGHWPQCCHICLEFPTVLKLIRYHLMCLVGSSSDPLVSHTETLTFECQLPVSAACRSSAEAFAQGNQSSGRSVWNRAAKCASYNLPRWRKWQPTQTSAQKALTSAVMSLVSPSFGAWLHKALILMLILGRLTLALVVALHLKEPLGDFPSNTKGLKYFLMMICT